MSIPNDTVTLSRAEYDALVERAEDAEDRLALFRHRLREVLVGPEEARAGAVTGDTMLRLLSGEPPLRVWREARGLSVEGLAAAAGLDAAAVRDIDDGRMPATLDAAMRLADVLGVGLDALAPG